jgi:two-component system response regulator RegA
MRKIATALLVDDDDAFRCALQGALRRRGVRALTAATVGEASAILEDEPIDLVALDYRMPEIDGLDAIGRFRKLRPDAVIIMITGFGDIPLTVAAMREGADTLLTKPVDADRLLDEARACAERSSARDKQNEPPPSQPGRQTYRLDDIEKETIEAALTNAGGVVATAAKMLGIDRRTLQRKMRRSQ